MTDYTFEGWLGHDKSADKGKMTWGPFTPKAWDETDIDIKISHCGICGTDLHTLRSGWGPTIYPCCVGHEIVGTAVRVGSEITNGIKVGDRVGVGAQSDSCQNRLDQKCEDCASDLEQYCPHFVGTYSAKHFNGGVSMGGYATYNRSPSHFVVKIPEGLESGHAAPMLCAGLTMYSPLKHYGCGPGKKVGIVGLGGLGHFGVLWAKALGADRVVAFSRRASKREDALGMGADGYIATEEGGEWLKDNARSLDIIVSTISSSQTSIGDYLSLLKKDGILVQVGNPDDGAFQVTAVSLIASRAKLAGSMIGSPKELREMLQLAADKKVRPMIEERPMKDANQAIVDMDNGKARFRYVLVNQ